MKAYLPRAARSRFRQTAVGRISCHARHASNIDKGSKATHQQNASLFTPLPIDEAFKGVPAVLGDEEDISEEFLARKLADVKAMRDEARASSGAKNAQALGLPVNPDYRPDPRTARPFYKTLDIGEAKGHIDDIDIQSKLRDLRIRPAHLINDYYTPSNSHLLNLSLADYIPQSCYPRGFSASNPILPTSNAYDAPYLPQGHHLVYFPTQVTSSSLLVDGTDILQFPGQPFSNRLWAGGSLLFRNSRHTQLKLSGLRGSCLERIQDVNVRGVGGGEKIFVSIERRYGYAGQPPTSGLQHSVVSETARLVGADESMFGEAQILERRDIVFLRPKTRLEIQAAQRREERLLRAPENPDLVVKITPSAHLLFRFSALTFNAHRIHLDPSYARQTEGHRQCLVHGPLLLVLMMSVLRSRLEPGKMIRSFSYRNIAPLYVDEELWICVKDNKDGPHRQDVWVQRANGSLAVKGQALFKHWGYEIEP